MKARILVVDDEEPILELMRYLLEGHGYEVVIAKDGQEGLKTFFAAQPHLVLLDILMPGLDGWQLLERIREVSGVPVIMLTARDHEYDAVRGLRSGADDYVIKPARLMELLARVESLLRKTQPSSGIKEEYRDSVLHVDFKRHHVYLKGGKLDLTPQEFRLLAALVRNAGLVLSTDRLVDICWGEVGGPEHVRVYVGYLRRKIEKDTGRPQLIQTVREFGYRYCPPDHEMNGYAVSA